MKGNRTLRRRYFSEHIKPIKSPAGYLQALLDSPYDEHRAEGLRLKRIFNNVMEKQNADTKEVQDSGTGNRDSESA